MPRERRNRSPRFKELARELRQDQNLVESILWERLRAGRLHGFKFRRQHPVGQYILDFYCAQAKVVIELDGVTHRGREVEDAKRQAWLESQGLLVARCPNEDVLNRLDDLLEVIWKHCVDRMEQGTDVPSR